MIIIVSTSRREARAVAAIAARYPQSIITCFSVSQFKQRLRTTLPAIVISRNRLADGYSDDVLALVRQSDSALSAKVVVLTAADCSTKEETRHLALGADCVLRDPVRPEVLSEYVGKFLRAPANAPKGMEIRHFSLVHATIVPECQRAEIGGKSTHLTPKEIELARLLSESDGKMLTYDFLYDTLFRRVFPGETSNLKVLLAKLVSSCLKLGFNLRESIRVLPKSGYIYLGPVSAMAGEGGTKPTKKPRPKSRL